MRLLSNNRAAGGKKKNEGKTEKKKEEKPEGRDRGFEEESLEEYEEEVEEEVEEESEERIQGRVEMESQGTRVDTLSNNMHVLLRRIKQDEGMTEKSGATEESEINDDEDDQHFVGRKIQTIKNAIN